MTQSSERQLDGFFAGAVGRPVAIAVAFITLLVLGGIAYVRVPIQLLPSGMQDPSLNIWVPNPDSNARENEENVARPIEEQLRTLAGITRIQSNSNDGYVYFGVQFDSKVDMDLARAEVRDRIERAWPTLPETAQPASMWSESADSLPISFFGITVAGDSARRDYLIDKVVKPRLDAVQGIGNVDLWGILQDSLRILLDEDKVIAAGLDLGTVIQRLSSDNFALPMGEVRDGGREILLRSDMRFSSPEEVAEFPIGDGLKVKDVGRVARVKSVRNELTLIDGEVAYYGMASKDSQSNVVETSQNLRRTVEEIENDPATDGDVKVTLFFLQGDLIQNALTQLQETALWGGVLAVGVLFVFLRRVRLTLCVALSIPVSALLAISFNYFTGGSFNLLAMAGITLGIGMLVDNSVVVVENIVRIKQRGEHPLTAAAIGIRQIGLAVTLATLTTVAVFVPLIFMSEDPTTRTMLGALGIPLAISLLASLFVAVVFLPVITARTIGSAEEEDQAAGKVDRALDALALIPARLFAWIAGAARVVAYVALRVAHFLNRVTLVPLRYLGVLVVLAVGVFLYRQTGRFGGSEGPASSLSEYGVTVGAPDSAVTFGLWGLFGWFALAILVASLFLARRRPTGAPERPASFLPEGRSLIEMALRANQQLVAWTLKHRVQATAVSCLTLATVIVPFSSVGAAAFGQEDSADEIGFRVVFDTEFTLGEARDQIQIYEDFLVEHQEEIGFDHRTVRFSEAYAVFQVHYPDSQTTKKVEDDADMLERELPRVSGHELIFYDENESSGTSKTVASFTLTGPDSRELERLAELAQPILEGVPGLSQVTSPLARAPEQIEVTVDRELATSLGVDTQSIQQSIAWTLGGFPLPRFQEEGREIPLVMEYDQEEIAGISSLRDLAVFAQSGAVPLTTIADLEFTRGARSIRRVDGQTSFTLEAKVDEPLNMIPVTEAAYRALGEIDLPRGFQWDRSDSASQRTNAQFSELLSAGVLSFVLVFLLMAILFESLILPFSVLVTIPFAFLGGWWTLMLTGTRIDVVGAIGLLILMGVVVNNGIVLVDRIHGLRDHMSRSDAILEGCKHRVRPILMTALTTVTGLLPMAVTEPPPQSIDYRALATVVAGGLICSTFFTLWVVPLAYTVLDDFWSVFLRWGAWWTRMRPRSSSASAGPEALPGGAAGASGLRR